MTCSGRCHLLKVSPRESKESPKVQQPYEEQTDVAYSKYHSLFFIGLLNFWELFFLSWWNFEQMAASWTHHVKKKLSNFQWNLEILSNSSVLLRKDQIRIGDVCQPNILVTLTLSLHDVFRTLPFAQSFTKREKRIPKSSTTVWRTNYGTLSTPPQKLSHHRVKTYMKTSR